MNPPFLFQPSRCGGKRQRFETLADAVEFSRRVINEQGNPVLLRGVWLSTDELGNQFKSL